MKRAKSGHFCIQPDTPTPRRGAPPRRRSLRLGELEPKFSEFSSPPRHSNAPPKRTCKLCFGSFIQLILTIIHWINEDPNKRMKGFVKV